MKIDSVHAEFMSGNAVSSTTSSHSIVSRDASGDIHAAGVSIAGNSGTLFSYSDGTRSVYGGCNASDPWFGTSSDHDLRLTTNGSERMRIDKTGNVGIGTSSPGTKFDVVGDPHTFIRKMAEAGTLTDDYNHILGGPRPGTTSAGAVHFINGSTRSDDGGNNTYTIRNDSGKLRLGHASFDTLLEGNVGIGTVSPGAALHVEGKSISTTELVKYATYTVFHHRDDGSFEHLLQLNVSDGQAYYDNRAKFMYVTIPDFSGDTIYTTSPSIVHSGYVNAHLRTLAGAKPNLAENTTYTFHVYSKYTDSEGNITTKGNVGIGTDDPDSIFHTQSNVGGDEVWVDQWKHSFDGNWNFRLSQRHDTGNTVEYGFKQRYNTTEYSPITFRGSTMELGGNVGIGTSATQGILTVRGLGADPYFSGYNQNALADSTDFTGVAHFKSYGSHGAIRITNESDVTGTTRLDFNTRLSSMWGDNVLSNGRYRGTAPTAGRIMVTGEINSNYEDAYMSFHTCRDQRPDGQGHTGNLYERMRITSEGNVGIGTTSPDKKLHVYGSIKCHNTGSTGDENGLFLQSVGDWYNLSPGNDGYLHLLGGASGQGHMSGNFSSMKLAKLITYGNVGIGLTNPSYDLDVRGGLAVSYADNNRMLIDGGGTIRRHYVSGSTNYGAGFHFTSNAIWATDYGGSYSAGGINFGSSTYRWNNVYTEALNASGDVTTGNNLYVGTNTNNETAKAIYFGGTYGDNAYNHCVIERRVWSTNTEKQELLLFSGNDGETTAGPDRIRLKGAQILFDTLNNSTDRTTENTKMIIRADGKVGIGITNPDVPLHVTATTSTSVGDTHRWVTINAISGGGSYTNKFGSALSDSTGGNYTYSIKTVGAISSPRFIIGSDERIKKDIVDVEDDEALVKLRMLHPKKYRYIDESAQGAHQVYGFLANEVQEVLPDAVVEHTNEVPSIYEFANATSSNVITFSGDFNTSQLESNVLVVVGADQVKHTLTVDEIIDSTSVRVVEDLSAFTGSLDEHGNVVTETQTLSITPEEYDELEDKDGFKPISDDNNVVSEYTKTTTTYVGDELFVYGEVVDDFKHLQESAISTLSTSALQEVDRQLQAEKARNDALESRVTELEGMVSLIRQNMTWPDA